MAGHGGGFKFLPNPTAPELLERTPAMRDMLQAQAERVAERARETAPVLTGHYRDSIKATAGIEAGGAKGRVNAFDFKAHWIEYGTVTMRAYAVLRNALDAAGLRSKH